MDEFAYQYLFFADPFTKEPLSAAYKRVLKKNYALQSVIDRWR